MAAFDVFSGPIDDHEALEEVESLLMKVVYSLETNQWEGETHNINPEIVAYGLAKVYTDMLADGDIDVELIDGDEAEQLYRAAWIRHYQGETNMSAEDAEESLWYDLDYRKMLLPKHVIERMAYASAAYEAASRRKLIQYMKDHPSEFGG
jgi:hypothetical protein